MGRKGISSSCAHTAFATTCQFFKAMLFKTEIVALLPGTPVLHSPLRETMTTLTFVVCAVLISPMFKREAMASAQAQEYCLSSPSCSTAQFLNKDFLTGHFSLGDSDYSTFLAKKQFLARAISQRHQAVHSHSVPRFCLIKRGLVY